MRGSKDCADWANLGLNWEEYRLQSVQGAKCNEQKPGSDAAKGGEFIAEPLQSEQSCRCNLSVFPAKITLRTTDIKRPSERCPKVRDPPRGKRFPSFAHLLEDLENAAISL